ncbi:MAG: DUF2220 family protein [Nitrospirae bacterium]|nr:DUF2220 family protein [Nitrospirota bacterium]
MSPAAWTTPDDVRDRLRKMWNSGRLMSAALSGETLFPYEWKIVRPKSVEWGERFDEVRRWIRNLSSGSMDSVGYGYQVRWEEIDHRVLGKNRMPVRVVVPSLEDALRLIGKGRDLERFLARARDTLVRFPSLSGWLLDHPFVFESHGDDWDRILAVLSWFVRNPRPERYLRQLDIEGVDTKFIESRRGILGDLLDRLLPEESRDLRFTGAREFEGRFGLLSKPALLRFRILDPDLRIQGLSDLSVPAREFSGLSLPVERVFITENEINGLAFPAVPGGIVLFGLGYALENLGQVEWLSRSDMFYWGDIDTHGMAMLDRLRGYFPRVQSFLMDRETLLAHRPLWGREPRPVKAQLSRLTDSERVLYDDLKDNRLGNGVRLEQERIPYHRVLEALSALLVKP